MTKVCCVCGKNECSYRCPVCKKPYCSVDCCNKHKANTCQPPEAQKNEVTNNKEDGRKYDFPTEDTVSLAKLEELRHNEEIQNCLKNPHLRDIMHGILTDKNPTQAIALAMTEPIFVEMADACLKLVEPQVDGES